MMPELYVFTHKQLLLCITKDESVDTFPTACVTNVNMHLQEQQVQCFAYYAGIQPGLGL